MKTRQKVALANSHHFGFRGTSWRAAVGDSQRASRAMTPWNIGIKLEGRYGNWEKSSLLR